MTTAEKLAQLDAHSARVLRCGGPKAVEKQHALGKRTARERIELLMDTGTFTEVDRFVRHRCTSFGMGDKDIPADGVVTGYGKIDGRTVFVYAQDFTASSGHIPQISVIMGPCAGGAVYSPALTDLIVMVEKESQMFITGPAVVAATTGEEISAEDLGGADTHTTMSGVAHLSARSEEEALGAVRCLLSYLPSKAGARPPLMDFTEHEELQPLLDTVIPDDSSLPYEVSVMKNFALPLLQAVPEENARRGELLELIEAFQWFEPIDPELVPVDSLLREFIGGGSYKYH